MLHIQPKSRAFEAACGYPPGLFEELAELGLMGMTVPEAFGGAALDYVSYALALMSWRRQTVRFRPSSLSRTASSTLASSPMAAMRRRRASCRS